MFGESSDFLLNRNRLKHPHMGCSDEPVQDNNRGVPEVSRDNWDVKLRRNEKKNYGGSCCARDSHTVLATREGKVVM